MMYTKLYETNLKLIHAIDYTNSSIEIVRFVEYFE